MIHVYMLFVVSCVFLRYILISFLSHSNPFLLINLMLPPFPHLSTFFFSVFVFLEQLLGPRRLALYDVNCWWVFIFPNTFEQLKFQINAHTVLTKTPLGIFKNPRSTVLSFLKL